MGPEAQNVSVFQIKTIKISPMFGADVMRLYKGYVADRFRARRSAHAGLRAPPLLHVSGGGGCVSGAGSSTLCGVPRTLSASCDSQRLGCAPLYVSR
jgi:hypothetical protein